MTLCHNDNMIDEIMTSIKLFDTLLLYIEYYFDRYLHGPEMEPRVSIDMTTTRAILPTELLYQSSVNRGGACRLPPRWTSCSTSSSPSTSTSTSTSQSSDPLSSDHQSYQSESPEAHLNSNQSFFCGNGTLSVYRYLKTYAATGKLKQRTVHDFDEMVTDGDSYYMNLESEGSILRQYFMLQHLQSEYSKNSSRLYAERYHGPVMRDLHSRGLQLFTKVLDFTEKDSSILAENEWDTLFGTEDLSKSSMAYTPPLLESSFNYSLPQNFSNRQFQDEIKLPNFAKDFSEYAIGAMIERVSDSYDLYATTFFLCHSLLEPKVGYSANSGLSMSSEVFDAWKMTMTSFEKTEYASNGLRFNPSPFYCNISHTDDGPYYIVEGSFVPNNLTPDMNANMRLDILRCKMSDTEHAYMNLANTSHEMRIEIIRGDFSLMKFRVPWGVRATGFMLDPPDNQIASRFDPWKGFNKSTPGLWAHDKLYMCVPGLEDIPSKTSLPLFLEWIQHHILMGASHIFVGAKFGWSTYNMQLLIRVMKSFIDDGLLTITSHSSDGLDDYR